MDFSHLQTSALSFSPSPAATKIELLLENCELDQADDHAYERFWRVWYTERSAYAPHLKDFTICLRPSAEPGGIVGYTGINRFLNYFRNNVRGSTALQHPLQVYMDCWSDSAFHIQYQTRNAPFEIRVVPQAADRGQSPRS